MSLLNYRILARLFIFIIAIMMVVGGKGQGSSGSLKEPPGDYCAGHSLINTIVVKDHANIPQSPIYLAGLSFDDSYEVPAIAVVWRPNRSTASWFPSWEIVLEIDDALVLNADFNADRLTSALGVLGPRPRHQYDVTLSYDPNSGLVSASVVDRTAGSLVLAMNTHVKPSSRAVDVGKLELPIQMELESSVSKSYFVPAGVQWSLRQLQIDRRQHPQIAVELAGLPQELCGVYQLVALSGSHAQVIATASAKAQHQVITIDTTSLPVGVSEMRLEYVAADDETRNDDAWVIGRQFLRVGVIEIALEPVEVKDGHWSGHVTLTGDGDFAEVVFELDAELIALSDLIPGKPLRADPIKIPLLSTELQTSFDKPMTLAFNIPIPSRSIRHNRWLVRFVPRILEDVTVKVSGEEDDLMIMGSGRYRPPRLSVELEEVVYQYQFADNGAGPTWARANSGIIRRDGRVFAAGLETLPDAIPLNNVVPFMLERRTDTWETVYKGSERTREPSPMAVFDDGRLFLSINPTLTPPDARNGPSEPRIVQFQMNDLACGYETLVPQWEGEPPFTEHSYRSFAADAQNHELVLFQNIGYAHAEWAFYDRHHQWSAQGKLVFPWANEYDEPGPVRIAYPAVALKDRAVYFFGVSDVVEPYKVWRERKRQLTGRDWDYDFRRLFLTWTDDIRTGRFHQWIEIATRDHTAGSLAPWDLYVDEHDNVHLLWTEQALNEMLRSEFFPLERQTHTLNYAVFRDGVILHSRVLHLGGEGYTDEIPAQGRFQITPSGRLFVVYVTNSPQGTRNWITEIFEDGTASPPQNIPLAHPFRFFFNATPRGGSEVSDYLDMFGTGSAPNTIRYARVRIDADP